MNGNRIEILSQQVVSRGITLASQEPGDLDRLFMLMRLNEAYASLVILAAETAQTRGKDLQNWM